MSTTQAVRISLPSDVAEELRQSGDAVPIFTHRGGQAAEVIQIALEGISYSASVVTLMVSFDACKRIARRILGGQADEEPVTVKVETPRNTLEVTVSGASPDAHERLAKFLAAALGAAE